MVTETLSLKYEKLLASLSEAQSAIVAFSGGVDSTLLLHAAKEALGDKALAVTISTPYVPRWEIAEAQEFVKGLGVEHTMIELPFPEEIRMNPADHCYTCKKILFGELCELAQTRGYKQVLDGTNIDDLADYRPGLKALAELGIISPLKDAGLTKQDIRDLSREFNLPTWDKPSFACLLSRLEIDTPVTDEALQRVEHAEVFLINNGFPAVRVRCHGDVARIEVPSDQVPQLVAANALHRFDAKLKELGFRHVAVDLAGYTMGSLNPKNEA